MQSAHSSGKAREMPVPGALQCSVQTRTRRQHYGECLVFVQNNAHITDPDYMARIMHEELGYVHASLEYIMRKCNIPVGSASRDDIRACSEYALESLRSSARSRMLAGARANKESRKRSRIPGTALLFIREHKDMTVDCIRRYFFSENGSCLPDEYIEKSLRRLGAEPCYTRYYSKKRRRLTPPRKEKRAIPGSFWKRMKGRRAHEISAEAKRGFNIELDPMYIARRMKEAQGPME